MTRPFQLCVLLFIVSTVLPAKPQPRVHPKVTTPAAGASQQWLRKLDRPPANTQVVKGAAPDAQWPVLLELRDGGGAVLESRQVFVNPEDMRVVAGFDRLVSADNMIIAYTVRNGTK